MKSAVILRSERNPGKIKREAPPGPEMTETEFKSAMDTMPTDAANWRWLQRNWSLFLEMEPPLTGIDLRELVDYLRKQDIGPAIQKSSR
jgi:hypothetical protein